MATITYTSLAGQFDDGNEEFGCANGYIFHPSWDGSLESRYEYADYVGNPARARRFFGSDKRNKFYYTYCAFVKLPKGEDFKITFRITGGNDFFGGATGTVPMCVGYCTIQPKSGSSRTFGNSNSPNGLVVQNFNMEITSKQASANTTSEDIVISIPSVWSGEKVYFYFWGKDVTTQYSCFPFEGLSASLEYTSYTNLSAPSIEQISPAIIGSNGKVQITINPSSDGINNAVKNYKIFYSTSPSITTNTNFISKTPNDNNIIEVLYSEIGSPQSGSKIYFGIQAIGEAEGYDSSLSYNDQHFITINFPPTQPVVQLSNTTISNNGENESIGINSIVSTDADGDTLTYYYVTSSSNATPSSGWAVLPDSKIIQANSTNKYIHFKAYDGKSYSSSTYICLTVNTGPSSFGVTSVTGEGFYGYKGACYTRTISVIAFGEDSYSYNWQYRYGTTGSWIDMGAGKTISSFVLTEGVGDIYVRVSAKDSYNDVKTSNPYNTKMRYLKTYTSGITITPYQLKDAQSKSSIEQFSRSMSANFSFSKMTENDAFIKQVLISLEYNNTTYDAIALSGDFNSKDSVVSKNKNFKFSESNTMLLEGAKLVFRLFAKNEAGEAKEIYQYSQNIKLFPLLPFTFGEGLNANQKQADLDIVDLTSTEQIEVNYSARAGINKYKILFTLEEAEKSVYVDDYVSLREYNDSTALIIFSDPQGLFQSLQLPSSKNIYTGTMIIAAENQLGESYLENNEKFKGSFSIKTTAPSVFVPLAGQSEPYILQHITYASNRPEGNHNPNWTQGLPSEKSRMFNPDEYIYFDTNFDISAKMNKHYDGSGNAPTIRGASYFYEISYTTVVGDVGPSKDSSWKVIPGLEQLSSLGTIKIPTNFSPDWDAEKIFFRIRVKDEYGLYVINEYNGNLDSLYVTDPTHYLLRSRKVEPNIAIVDCEKENDYYKVRFSIKDYGGNGGGFENFVRKPSQTIGERKEGCMKITWICGPTLSSLSSVSEPPIIGSITDLAVDSFGYTNWFSFGSLNNTSGRIYIKATVAFYYNSKGDALVTETPVFALYTETPTVAYRSHLLGINTKPDSIEFNEDVLVISDFQGKRYVRLIGLNEEDATAREIFIDLKTGLTSGLVIDGGTW